MSICLNQRQKVVKFYNMSWILLNISRLKETRHLLVNSLLIGQSVQTIPGKVHAIKTKNGISNKISQSNNVYLSELNT
jgi:hypothetical protein